MENNMEDFFNNLINNGKLDKVEDSDVETEEAKPKVEAKEDETEEDVELKKRPEKESAKEAKEEDDEEDKPSKKVIDDAEMESLKKSLTDTRKWGHKKNLAYISARKKMTEYLTKLQENGTLLEDEVKEALGAFSIDLENDADAPAEVSTRSPYISAKERMDKEFSIFKRYSKEPNLTEKYNSFYHFWPMLSEEEQETIMTYIQEEEPEIALDKIMSMGSDLYESIYKGAQEKGGIVQYVNSLHNKLAKLQKKYDEMHEQLDSTTAKVYNSPIKSKVQAFSGDTKNQNPADWFSATFGS